MPLVCSDFGGSVVLDAKCSAKLVEVVLARGGTRAQAKEPVGERLPLSVRIVRMRIGQARSRSRRKQRALPAGHAQRCATPTHEACSGARSELTDGLSQEPMTAALAGALTSRPTLCLSVCLGDSDVISNMGAKMHYNALNIFKNGYIDGQ